MTTAIFPRQGFSLRARPHAVSRLLRVIASRLSHGRERRRRRHIGAGNQLDLLSDRLRQDIGLSDSSPSPAELLQRFHRMHAACPREHEFRLKAWTW